MLYKRWGIYKTGGGGEWGTWVIPKKECEPDGWFESVEGTGLMDAWEWLGVVVSVLVGAMVTFETSWSSVEFSVVAAVGGGCAAATPASIGLVHCSSCHPVCSFTVYQMVSRDFKLFSSPCNTNHHLSLPDLVDCLLINFRLTWISFTLFNLVRWAIVFLTVVQVIKGNVPHTLLAPLTGSLSALVAAAGSLFRSAIVPDDPEPPPEGAEADVRLTCFWTLRGIRRVSRGFLPTLAA